MDYKYYQDQVQQCLPMSIDSGWGQGRSAFGGLTAALVLTHIEQQTGLTDRDLRTCLLYTSPSPRDGLLSRMPSSA